MRLCCVDDFAVLDLTPDFKRLLLALFFLTADERDNVIYHLGPSLKCLAGAGNGLVGAYDNPVVAVLIDEDAHELGDYHRNIGSEAVCAVV